MKNKKMILAAVAFVLVIALAAGLYFTLGKEEAVEGSKTFTVIVVHGNGEEKTFTYTTDADKLGPVLVEKGLIVEADSPGMYNTVDGETADWSVNQSYWGFYVGEEYATEGMDDTTIHDGDVFKLVYTLG